MQLAANIFIAIVAIEHLYILWLEMFAWTTKGRKVFRSIPPDMFEKTKTMAANQGLYNGFLAAGLIWSLLIRDTTWQYYVAAFFSILCNHRRNLWRYECSPVNFY